MPVKPSITSTVAQKGQMSATKKLLAVAVFGTLIWLAYQRLWGELTASPAASRLAAECPTPYYPITNPSGGHIFYTGIALVDQKLCTLVSFFAEGLKPPSYRTVLALLLPVSSAVLIPLLEGVRNKRSLFIALPSLVGLAYQLYGGGLIIPIYWILFIVVGSSLTTPDRSREISRREAIAVFWGWALGFLLPTLGLLTTNSARINALWQAFPLIVAPVHLVVFAIQPATADNESGTRIVQSLYITAFVFSVSSYLYILFSAENLKEAYLEVYAPSLTGIKVDDLVLVVKNFLQWDLIFIFGSTAASTLWFANDFTQFIGLALTNLVLTPLLGPGSPIALIMVWRESVISSGQKAKAKTR